MIPAPSNQDGTTKLLRFGLVLLACLLVGCATLTIDEIGEDAPVAGVGAPVLLSARYVIIRGRLPAPDGALGFLSDEAGLREGAVVLATDEAEAVLSSLTRLTGAAPRSTLLITVAEGQRAELHCKWATPRAEKLSAVKIVVGGVEQEFTPRGVGASLKVSPRVISGKRLRLEMEVFMTSFDGFVEYGGEPVEVSGRSGNVIKVPDRFYQPIFSTTSEPIEIDMASGEVVVLRTQRMVTETPFARVADLVGKDDAITTETTLIFLTALIEPVGR